MIRISRRTLVQGARGGGVVGSDRPCDLLGWAKAWAQTAPWKPEKGAKLSMLRWKYFVQSEDDAFVKHDRCFHQGDRRQGRYRARIV